MYEYLCTDTLSKLALKTPYAVWMSEIFACTTSIVDILVAGLIMSKSTFTQNNLWKSEGDHIVAS